MGGGGVTGSLDSQVTYHQLVSVTDVATQGGVDIRIALFSPRLKQQQHSVAILAQVVDIRRRISAAWVVSLIATCSRHDLFQGSCQELVVSDMIKVVLVFGSVSIAGAKFDAMSGFEEPGSGDTEVSPLDGFSAGSENVSKNQFYVGFSWPVPVSSGHMTGWVSSPCYAALMLMRFCGSAPVCLCGFCPADAACRWLLIYLWCVDLPLVP